MATETISQILSPENATYINGVSAERRIAPAVLKNSYQRLVEKGGRGINDTFVSEDDAQSSAQVLVNRVLPSKLKPREQGANKNGASYSANGHYVNTETVGINILCVIDDPIHLPRARQDMIKVDLLAEQVEILSARNATILNGATFAEKWLTYAIAKSKGDAVNEKKITSTDVTNKVVLNKFIEANSLLDEGDEAHGIDLFPENTRVCVIKPSWRATLKTNGILTVGGANYGYEIAQGSGLNQGVTATRSEDGYIGDIDGVPCHIISNESLGHAAEFCGFPTGEFKSNGTIGYISSSYANARGVSTAKSTKIVDDPAGQGLILQPFTKFGVASWYPKGNVVLADKDLDIIGDLKTIFSSSDIVFKTKPSGSRLFPTGGTWTVGASAFTLASVTALDDWSTDHVEGACFFVGDAAVTTVGDFLAGYSDATYKGTFTIGTSKSTTIADTKYVNALVIADDGSISLFSKQYNA